MHRLTQTLLAAQLRQSSIPYVEASLSNRWGGVAQLTWERIYSAPEPDDGSRAALSSASSGALLRVRTDPGAGTLHAQRVSQSCSRLAVRRVARSGNYLTCVRRRPGSA